VVTNYSIVEVFVKKVLFILMVTATLMYSCSHESPTKAPMVQGSILLNPLAVSLVPGGTETVTICATKTGGVPDNCTFNVSNPNVAAVTLSDSTLHITGLNYGTTDINITSLGGLDRTLPVHVYNPNVLETNDLLVTFVDNYSPVRWADWGSGGSNDGSFYHPVTTDGFRALGSLGLGPDGYPNPNGAYAMMVVKAKPGHENALAEPVDYHLIYYDHGSGADMYGSFWRPIPPPGYVAMGTVVANNTWNRPSLSDVVCVREDLAMIAESGTFIYNDVGTGADMFLSCWKIDQPATGPHDLAYLTTGTFVAVDNWDQPSVDPAMYVLKLDLPTLYEAPYQSYVPRLTGYDSPPDETAPMMAKAMLVPCTIVNDPLYNGNIGWRVANSPMYRLERYVYYKKLYHNHNQTSETQTNSVTITSGVTTEQSNSVWTETGVSLSVEAGVSIEAVSGKVTATISQSFGYETQTSVTELTQSEISSSINTAPGKAAALWQQYNRYILYRHNGTQLEPVSSWEFGIESYVTDEYPH
jgi:hypothetical protein